MPKFRKKPVVIDAFQWVPGAYFPAPEFDALHAIAKIQGHGPDEVLAIETLEGVMRASPGDYIIRGVKGEFYPCKPEIFLATYEPA